MLLFDLMQQIERHEKWHGKPPLVIILKDSDYEFIRLLHYRGKDGGFNKMEVKSIPIIPQSRKNEWILSIQSSGVDGETQV